MPPATRSCLVRRAQNWHTTTYRPRSRRQQLRKGTRLGFWHRIRAHRALCDFFVLQTRACGTANGRCDRKMVIVVKLLNGRIEYRSHAQDLQRSKFPRSSFIMQMPHLVLPSKRLISTTLYHGLQVGGTERTRLTI